MEFINGEPKQIDYDIKIIMSGKEEEKYIFLERLIMNDKVSSKLDISFDPIGFDSKSKCIKFKNKIFRLYIFNYYGIELGYNIIRCSDVFLLFYDAYDRYSFEKVKNKVKYIYEQYELQNNNFNCILFLIRSKYELSLKSQNDDYVSDEEAMEYADKNNMLFTHISSFEKYDSGIKNLLNLILIEYLRRNKKIIKLK